MSNAIRYVSTLPEDVQRKVLNKLTGEHRAKFALRSERLASFIHRVTARYTAPPHLAPLIQRLEDAREREVRCVIHAPPRHVKTDTILNAFAWHLGQDPTRTHGFVTYSADLSRSKSRKARNLAIAGGVNLAADANRLDEWLTTDGGGLVATGVGGPLTGRGITGLLVVDDPVKNRVEAESETTREKVWEWFNDVAYTRLEPGSSCIVVMTRWHPQDLAGKLIDDKGWEYIKLPAIDEAGAALWPDRFPLSVLSGIREQIGEYTWTSLYQGEPRNRGGAVFGDVHSFDLTTQNRNGFRLALGADLAYSEKKYADYSVAVVMAEHAGIYYVLDVQRHQIKAPKFDALVKGLKKTYGVHKTRWYTNTTEEGLADMIGVKPVLAKDDKFIRAQPVAAAWNAGKVLVPEHAPWLDKFVSEVCGFTGIEDEHDDQVDALAAAYDALAGAGATYDGLPREGLPQRRA